MIARVFGIFIFLSNSYKDRGVRVKHIKSNAEWAKILTPEQYDVLRNEGTEPPHSSSLNSEKKQGIFLCAACGLALFESAAKYDSGTGWPSFWQPIQGHVDTKTDWKLFYPRRGYHCAGCGGHQGHVFTDGPLEKGGKRYCNNGIALKFIPRE